MKIQSTLTLLAAAMLATPLAHAGIIAYTLPGTTEFGSWYDLNNSNYTVEDGYNDFGTNTDGWEDPIAAVDGTTSAVFDKTPGFGGYPASGSIYTFFSPGQWSLTNATPVSSIETLVFQIDMLDENAVAPEITLSYNGGTQALLADFTGTTAGDYFFGEDPSSNYMYQWDLSGLGVTSYELSWNTGLHTAIFEMRTDSGDEFVQVVPEPSAYATLSGLAIMSFILYRRKRISQ